MVQLSFDASQVPTFEASMPVWDGLVLHAITKSEAKPTAANNGSNMLVLTVQALDGPYRGQENVIRLNMWNVNPVAVDMAQRQYSSLCHVLNKIRSTMTEELHGIPFVGVWQKEERQVQDQTTGQMRTIEGCQCKDFRLFDGRTIAEVRTGQPASQPYVAGGGSAPAAAQAQAQQHAPQPQPQQTGGQPQMQQQFNGPQGGTPAAGPGFSPPAPGFQPQPQPGQGGFAPPAGAAQQGNGFAPPTAAGAPAGGSVPAQGGFQPPQMGAGIPTAQSGFSPAPQQGFAPPQAGPGFAPPAAPQPGAGPWGPQGQQQR